MPRKHIILLSLFALLAGCNSKSVSSAKASSTINTPAPVTPTPLPTPLPTATPQPVDEVQKEKSIYGAMQYTVPEAWKIGESPVEESPYHTDDFICILKEEKKIEISLLMGCPAGIGYDRVYERNIEDLHVGSYTLNGGISDNNTHLELTSMLFANPDHGIIFVNYTNPNGASENDSDLISFLNSLEVNDCFGTVTVEADEINIRDRENTDGNIVGTAKKGETYKVFGIKGPSEYTNECTWYNIGYSEYIADINGEWLRYIENK